MNIYDETDVMPPPPEPVAAPPAAVLPRNNDLAHGLTKREYAAIQIASAIIAFPGGFDGNNKDLAKVPGMAIAIADLLMAELGK